MSLFGDSSEVGGPLASIRNRLDETLSGWRRRLAMLQGIFVKDPVRQIGRLLSVLRHFEEYREVDRALFYQRFASNMLVAYELGIFEALIDGKKTAPEIAGVCDIEVEAARNILAILESQDLVRSEKNRWEATSFVGTFFDDESAVSLAPMLDIGVAYATSFAEIVDGAKTGSTPASLDVFEQQGRTDALLDGVNAYLEQAGRELIARVDWPEIRHFIVGSMGVSFSSLILDSFADARVTYGCLPHLVERIPRLRTEYDVEPDRVVETHGHGGEPAEDQWGREAFDLVFLTKKMILDPDNELGEKFARKAHRVLQPGGVAVFWETIYESDGSTPVDRGLEGYLDFGVSPTGPVLTRDEFRRRLRNIGYRDIEVVSCLEGATTFVVARAGEKTR